MHRFAAILLVALLAACSSSGSPKQQPTSIDAVARQLRDGGVELCPAEEHIGATVFGFDASIFKAGSCDGGLLRVDQFQDSDQTEQIETAEDGWTSIWVISNVTVMTGDDVDPSVVTQVDRTLSRSGSRRLRQ